MQACNLLKAGLNFTFFVGIYINSSPASGQVIWKIISEENSDIQTVSSQPDFFPLEPPTYNYNSSQVVWSEDNQNHNQMGSLQSVKWVELPLVPTEDPTSDQDKLFFTRKDCNTVSHSERTDRTTAVPCDEDNDPEQLALNSANSKFKIQTLNRSVAFSDGLVGPDISLRIPNGFRWSKRWFGDVSILGYDYQNGRNPGDPFIPARDSGNLDGWGIIHANILQTTNWSFALNTSFRSLQNNPDIPGGSTGIADGVSSGFRIARAIGNTGGIAFGGEQLIQWDDNTDTGRNLYLMASNGWWLGNNGKDYPLFIANGGFGTGRFASLTDKDEPFNFTCTPVESNRKIGKVDENLCWGPIGSVSLVFDEWWGTFVEYAIGRATLGISANLTGGIPLRVTAGVHFAENDEIVSFDELRWITQFSIGF